MLLQDAHTFFFLLHLFSLVAVSLPVKTRKNAKVLKLVKSIILFFLYNIW